TDGRLVVTADPYTLGSTTETGVWHASPFGAKLLAKLGRFAGLPPATLVTRIQRSTGADPFAPAVVVPHATWGLTSFLAERSHEYPGLTTAALPTRRYPHGAFGSEFLG